MKTTTTIMSNICVTQTTTKKIKTKMYKQYLFSKKILIYCRVALSLIMFS